MFINRGGNPFVCLDEISGNIEPYNPVVYNPCIPFIDNKRIIINTIRDRFNTTLSEDVVESLLGDPRCSDMNFVITSLQKLIMGVDPTYRNLN